MADIEVLQEKEITTPILESLFERAFFKTTIDSDGDLVVHTEYANVSVIINENSKLIKLMSIYGIKDNADEISVLRFLNEVNREVVMVRFSVPENHADVLLAEYYLPYDEHLSTFQLVNTLRFFARIVPSIVNEYDTQNLVE